MITFTDKIYKAKESFELPESSSLTGPMFLGIDVLSEMIQFDTVGANRKVYVPEDVLSYITDVQNYIKNLGSQAVKESEIGNVEALVKYLNNTVIKRAYPYRVQSALLVNKKILNFINSFLLDYIQVFSHAFYISDTKSDQNYAVNTFLSKLENKRALTSNFEEFIKYDQFSIIETVFYESKYGGNPTPFYSINRDIEPFNDFDFPSYLNELIPIIKKTFKSKLYEDVLKGKIRNDSLLNNAILFLFFIISVLIELFIRNVYDTVQIIRDLKYSMIDPSEPVYFPNHIQDSLLIGDGKSDTIFSYEVNPTPDNATNNVKLDEKYKKNNEEAYKLYLRTIKMGIAAVKNWLDAKFFKSNLGKIKDVYTFANHEELASLVEHAVTGDPVEILKNDGPKILNNIGQNSVKLFNEVIAVAKDVSNDKEADDKLDTVKKFCKFYKIEDGDEPKVIKEKMVKEVRMRIAKIILPEVNVYGYSEKSIAENGKIPPAHHIVASIFLSNPFDKPQKMTIGDIFKSPESFEVFADPSFMSKISQTYKATSQNMINNINHKVTFQAVSNLNKSYSMFEKGLSQRDIDKSEAKKEKVIAKAINAGLKDIVEMAWRQKFRSLQLVDSMFNMSREIMKLAKKSLSVLIAIDKANVDSRYKSGATTGGTNVVKKQFKEPKENITIKAAKTEYTGNL